MRKNNQKCGYTLLFAVLIASLALGVAAFILGVARKQYVLSSTARDSLYSIYAADSGLECIAKIWGSSPLSIGTSTPDDIDCGHNATRNVAYSSHIEDSLSITYKATTSFAYAKDGGVPTNNNDRWGCSVITIEQTWLKSNLDFPKVSVIKSRGYNLCETLDGGVTYGPEKSSRTVERALQWVIQ